MDFENDTVFIKEQRQQVRQYGEIIKDPKTESGTRLISVSPLIMDILRKLRVHQFENRLKLGTAWIDNDYVFKHSDGKPIYALRPNQWLTALLKKHNLPKVTVHGLRHTNASIMRDRGFDAVALSGRLGHADPNVTNAVYLHEMKEKKKVAANIMQDFYGQTPEEPSKIKRALL